MEWWYPWAMLIPAFWLLFGLPWWERRMKERHERERERRKLEWELVELWATRGREGLEAKLLADLKALMFTSILRELRSPDGASMKDLTAAMRGEVTDDAARLPVAGGDPLDGLGLWLWPLSDLSGRWRRRRSVRRGLGEGAGRTRSKGRG